MVPSRNYIQTVRQFISKMKPSVGFYNDMYDKQVGRETDRWVDRDLP